MVSELEKYPHVMKMLELLWLDKRFDEYMQSIILMDRVSRRGFSKEAMQELLILQRVHKTILKEN